MTVATLKHPKFLIFLLSTGILPCRNQLKIIWQHQCSKDYAKMLRSFLYYFKDVKCFNANQMQKYIKQCKYTKQSWSCNLTFEQIKQKFLLNLSDILCLCTSQNPFFYFLHVFQLWTFTLFGQAATVRQPIIKRSIWSGKSPVRAA